MSQIKHLLLLTVLAIATPLRGQDLGDIALLVFEQDQQKATAQLELGLRSEDPRLRAAAARVAGVRKLQPVLPLLKSVARKEANAEAAREELRAIILLGGEKELDEALLVSQRFDSRLDASVATTLARTGVSPTLFFTRLNALSSRGEFLRIALWHRPQLLTPILARALGQSDGGLWSNLLDLLEQSEYVLDPALAAAALGSPSLDIRSDTLWHLTDQIRLRKSAVPASVLQSIDQNGENKSSRVDIAFGQELLRRLAGRAAVTRPEWLVWLKTEEARKLLDLRSPRESLTQTEFKVFRARWKVLSPAWDPTVEPVMVADPQFLVPSTLPKGLAGAVMAKLKCKSQWVGVGGAAIDSAGRISQTDLSAVVTTEPCRKALETLLRLSLATNTSLTSKFVSKNVVLVRAQRAPLCLDESDVASVSTMRNAEASPRPVANDVKEPRVKRRIEPVFPEDVRKHLPSGSVVRVTAQAVISETGCVRNPFLVAQSPYPTINTSALLALSEWTFDPTTLDGETIPVIFHLTVNFRK